VTRFESPSPAPVAMQSAGAGRETGPMSELPPPAPPVPGASAPTPPGPPSTAGCTNGRADDTAGDDGIDWTNVRELAERWYRPVIEPDGWRALAYLLLSALLSPFLFGAMAAVAAITFGLSFILVGLLLIVPFFLMVEQFARLELALARRFGHDIEPRPTRPLGGVARAYVTVLTDPVRWRQVGFVAANVVMAWIFFAFGSFPLQVVAQVLFGDGVIDGPGFSVGPRIEVDSFSPVAWVLAALAVGAIPRVAIWVADVRARVDRWFLGTDRLAEAEQRVSVLSTQRREILDAVASERRRIERNLHDGVQQQLVAIGLDLGMAEQQLARDPDRARELIVSARGKVQGSIGELRQLGRGLHPAILQDRGIDAALSAIVSGAPIPISVHVDPDLDLSTDVAETVYFIANELIANVLKHARARVASIHVTKVAANVRITVHDDGVGGVDAARGTGVAGVRARVHAVDGTLSISSPAGGPTTFVAELPRTVEGRDV